MVGAATLKSTTRASVREIMGEDQRGRPTESRFRSILRDVHFWVPVAVLLIGLLVLRWMH